MGSQALAVLLLSLLSGLLAFATVIAAPLPLMLIHRNFGRLWFLIGVTVTGAVLGAFAPAAVVVAFAGAALMSLIFCECERAHFGYTSSISIVTLILVGFGIVFLGLAMQKGFDPVIYMRAQIDAVLSGLMGPDPSSVNVDKDALLGQMPSAFLIGLILTVWLNSLLTERVETVLGWAKGPRRADSLLQWRLPDFFIWIALASTAGSFFNFEPKLAHIIASNVFNFMVLLYFFQGLAVIASWFEAKRVSGIWRTVVYLLIFSQFFLMVAMVGFADFWLDFRRRTKVPPKEQPNLPG